MGKPTVVAFAFVIAVLAALVEQVVAQTPSPKPAASAVSLLPPLLNGTNEYTYNGREFRTSIEIVITKQDGATGVGNYTRFLNGVPPCNSYDHVPMTYEWDGTKLDVVVLKGDQCERKFTLTRGVDHYFVIDGPTFNAYFDPPK